MAAFFMELKDFIKNSIIAISDAILESQEALSDKGVLVNPNSMGTGKDHLHLSTNGYRYVQNLNFDISVSADETSGVTGAAGLKVLNVFKLGGEGKITETSNAANRLSFFIPVAFPVSKVDPKIHIWNSERL